MAKAYSDNFERAALGTTNWTAYLGVPQIYDSHYYGGDPGEEQNLVVWNQTVDTQDQYVEVVYNAVDPTAANQTGIYIRMDASGNGYELTIGKDIGTLLKFVAGSGESLFATGAGCAAGDTVRFEANGSTIRYLINGVEQATVEDSSYTSGRYAWMSVNYGIIRIDSWAFGDIVAGAPAGGSRLYNRRVLTRGRRVN